MEEKRSIRPRGAIPGFRGKTRKEMAESLLSDRDRHHLSQGARKHALLRDGVAAVARGRHAGFFLGGGGIGKSMPLAEELRRLDVPFVLTNAHVRGRGLADRLHACPDSIHVREDVGETVHDRPRSAAIRAAPGAPGDGICRCTGRRDCSIMLDSRKISLTIAHPRSIIQIDRSPAAMAPMAQGGRRRGVGSARPSH